MSLLSIAPDIVAGASENLAGLGSALRSANAAAATQTTSIRRRPLMRYRRPSRRFLARMLKDSRPLSAKAAAFHDDFVNLLKGGAAQYVGAEAANGTTVSGNFGPFSYSLTETATAASGNVTLDTPFHPALSFSATETSSGADVSATGTFTTPLGTVELADGQRKRNLHSQRRIPASLSAHTPFGPPLSLSATGTPISTATEVGETVNATGGLQHSAGYHGHLEGERPGKHQHFRRRVLRVNQCTYSGCSTRELSVTGTVEQDGSLAISGGSIKIGGISFSF